MIMFNLPLKVGICLALACSVSATWNYSSVGEHCTDIWDFTGDGKNNEAPTKVTTAQYVAANGTVPAYCEVTGVIDLDTTFEMRIPARGEDWAGVFSQQGCGGSCGLVDMDFFDGAEFWPADQLRKGWTSAATSMGHTNPTNGSETDFFFARNNRRAEILFGYQSTHLLTVAGKALCEYYYGKPVKTSYFRGGSTGGRQAMVIAQRFPYDFDGIICMFPSMNETAAALGIQWHAQHNRYPNGTSILKLGDLTTIQNAALAACDASDGLIDGIIDPSFGCKFDPSTMLCGMTNATECFNEAQVAAANAFYQPRHDSHGKDLSIGTIHAGNELEWTVYTSSNANGSGDASGVSFGGSSVANLIFEHDLPLPFNPDTFDWDTLPTVGYMEQFYTGSNADLTQFRARGGKMIFYQGWQDYFCPPNLVIEWYQKVRALMGSQAKVDDFLRLFLIPGVTHGVETGTGAGRTVNFYDYIEDWIVNGHAPEFLVGGKYNNTGYPMDNSEVLLFERRHYAYPYASVLLEGRNQSLAESWGKVLVDETVFWPRDDDM